MHDESSIEALKNEFKGGIVDISAFELKKQIGKGGFGEVWRAIHKPTGTECAVKRLFMNESDADDEFIEMYVREVKILGQIKYLFCLRLLGFSVKDPFIIVTPFIQSGSLFDYVCTASNKARLPPTNLTLIAMGVAYGLMKLHESGIIHRDLKSPNILLDQRLLPYICDFGIARPEGGKMTKDIGTTYWMAPEQMDSPTYTNKVDVYSYGCILYEMLANQWPYQGRTSYKAAALIMAGHRPKLPDHDKSICALITKCWSQNPDDRPTMRNIFKAFCRSKFMFDGTEAKGIKAMVQIIKKNDEKIAPKIESWLTGGGEKHSTGDKHKKESKDSPDQSPRNSHDKAEKAEKPEKSEKAEKAEKSEKKHHHHHHHDKK